MHALKTTEWRREKDEGQIRFFCLEQLYIFRLTEQVVMQQIYKSNLTFRYILNSSIYKILFIQNLF